MNPDPPLISAPPGYAPLHNLDEHKPWHLQPRVRLFGLVFLVTLVIGLVATALQPALYRSSATVLMTAAMAIDVRTAEASTQRVAIQRRVLLGGEVTRQVLDQLQADGYDEPTLKYLRDVLSVEPVPGTNLVEMAAEGAEPELLPVLVNTWIDVYLTIRSNHVEASQKQTKQVVEDQLSDLEVKLADAREALAAYREEHDISSAERQENEEMARLDGLNQALNLAVEEEIKSETFAEAIREAIADGEEVVPRSERMHIEQIKREIAQIDSRLKNLRKNYTDDFVARNPLWRDLPDRKAELEEELATALIEGRIEMLQRVEQRQTAAREAVLELEERLEEQKVRSAEFTTIYATHQSLAQDLAELEALNRSTQSRLVKVEVNQVEKYPQVSVIDRPAPESLRIGPNYPVWLGGSVGAALFLAILAVWLHGFLGPRQKPAFVTLSGVHMYPTDNPALAQAVPAQQLPQASAPLLQKQPGEEQAPQDEPSTTPGVEASGDDEPDTGSPGQEDPDTASPDPEKKA